MKEAVIRTSVEKERTKLRERQRRSITTNIFHGLRKHGGYRLSPRADINEVLTHLAREAGWTVDPDGTTYRSSDHGTNNNNNNSSSACPLCGGGRKSTASSGSYLGDCSTTASPRRESAGNHLSAAGVMAANEALLTIYMCSSSAQQNGHAAAAAAAGGGGGVYGEGHQLYLLQQNTASNQSTPAGSL